LELAAEARKRAEAAEAEARARRLRDEEQRALMAKLDRMPAAERARFLEEEKIVARGRELAAKWRREGERAMIQLDLSMFGVEIEIDAGPRPARGVA